MTTIAQIQGYEGECNCDHCGRNLKIGIRLAGYGIIGADCLNAAIKFDKKRWGGGKPGAAYLRQLAKMKEKESADSLSRIGYHARAFEIEINMEKLN